MNRRKHTGRHISIGTKILIPVGAAFILFTLALALLIGVTSFGNLTQAKLDELERMSGILTNNIHEQIENTAIFARSVEQNDRIVRELVQLARFGPYYADPGDYVSPLSIGEAPQMLDDASQIFALQANLNLLAQLQGSLQTNHLDSIGIYLQAPYGMVAAAAPTLNLWVDHEQVLLANFPYKGALRDVALYRLPNANVNLSQRIEDYFDISSVYSQTAARFYQELQFQLVEAAPQAPSTWGQAMPTDDAQASILYDAGVPILQTVYPLRIPLPHPETWELEQVAAAMIVIEQHLDAAALAQYRNLLGLDLALARGNQLLISTLGAVSGTTLHESEATITLGDEVYYVATAAIEDSADGLRAVILSPRADVQQLISDLQQQIFWIASLIIIGGSVILYFSVQAFISAPLRKLTAGAEEIERGEFSSRVRMRRKDELGQLAAAFNTMAHKVESLVGSLEVRVDARTRDLQTAVDVTREITTVLALENLLPQVVKLTAERYQFYAVSILLPDETGETLRLSASINQAGEPFSQEENFQIPIKASRSIMAQAARTRRPVIANDVAQNAHYLYMEELAETRSELAIPMLLGRRLLGVFDVQSERINSFGEDEITALQIIAKQTGIAVRNAQLFAALTQARKQAEQANIAKSAFLASVSHELRTPLNSIINFTEFVRHGMKGPVTDDQVETLSEVISASEHLLHLINDVLDMSKIESGSLSLYIEEGIDVQELLRTAIATAESLITDRPIEIRTNISADLPTIRADGQRILQILINIVSNACKFTDAGYIAFSAKREGDNILIAIEDTGAGISQEQAPMVFESFKQTDTGKRKGGGTGLGMSISKVLAEEHKGALWFISTPDEGTTFYLKLPIASPDLVVLP